MRWNCFSFKLTHSVVVDAKVQSVSLFITHWNLFFHLHDNHLLCNAREINYTISIIKKESRLCLFFVWHKTCCVHSRRTFIVLVCTLKRLKIMNRKRLVGELTYDVNLNLSEKGCEAEIIDFRVELFIELLNHWRLCCNLITDWCWSKHLYYKWSRQSTHLIFKISS